MGDKTLTDNVLKICVNLRNLRIELRNSGSRMLGELLAEKMLQDERYAAAMKEFLAPAPVVLSRDTATAERPYHARKALHER